MPIADAISHLDNLSSKSPVSRQDHLLAVQCVTGLHKHFIETEKELKELRQESIALKAKVSDLETLVKANETKE